MTNNGIRVFVDSSNIFALDRSKDEFCTICFTEICTFIRWANWNLISCFKFGIIESSQI